MAERGRRDEPRETQIARWMVGWTLRLVGRNAEALAIQERLKSELEQAGIDDPYVDEELDLLRGEAVDLTTRRAPGRARPASLPQTAAGWLASQPA